MGGEGVFRNGSEPALGQDEQGADDQEYVRQNDGCPQQPHPESVLEQIDFQTGAEQGEARAANEEEEAHGSQAQEQRQCGRPQAECRQNAAGQIDEGDGRQVLHQVDLSVIVPDEGEGQADENDEQGLRHEGSPLAHDDASRGLPSKEQEFAVAGFQLLPDGEECPEGNGSRYDEYQEGPENAVADARTDKSSVAGGVRNEAEQEEQGQRRREQAEEQNEGKRAQSLPQLLDQGGGKP